MRIKKNLYWNRQKRDHKEDHKKPEKKSPKSIVFIESTVVQMFLSASKKEN